MNQGYADAKNVHIGTMQCTVCGKQILDGQFRYSETKHGFSTQHRNCVTDDNAWKKLDAKANKLKENNLCRLAAYIEFRDKWGTNALDDEITQLLQG